jgi:ubiquinone/menaquinone biosynthesis C-methylase UbiE
VEIGGGPFPTPGYIHVDADRRSAHLEYVAPAWRLPFPDGSVDELLAVHVLEHVHPARLDDTLREWRRVLAPGGYAQIHVPDGEALARAFLAAEPPQRWAIGAALLGMDSGPDVRRPTDLQSDRNQPDHKVVLDRDLLRAALIDAGFGEVEDLTGTVGDRHTAAWQPVVPNISAVLRARR